MDISSKENHHICLWCGQPSIIIWVHGHGQCSACGYNVDECCRGESNIDQKFYKPIKKDNADSED